MYAKIEQSLSFEVDSWWNPHDHRQLEEVIQMVPTERWCGICNLVIWKLFENVVCRVRQTYLSDFPMWCYTKRLKNAPNFYLQHVKKCSA